MKADVDRRIKSVSFSDLVYIGDSHFYGYKVNEAVNYIFCIKKNPKFFASNHFIYRKNQRNISTFDIIKTILCGECQQTLRTGTTDFANLYYHGLTKTIVIMDDKNELLITCYKFKDKKDLENVVDLCNKRMMKTIEVNLLRKISSGYRSKYQKKKTSYEFATDKQGKFKNKRRKRRKRTKY